MKNLDLFCYDLPSKPKPEIGTVLVTGASGYIGGRLVPELLARGYRVRAMVRADSPEYAQRWPNAEIVVADALDLQSLQKALEGIDTAYYLLHSLRLGLKKFEEVDIQAAQNFCQAAQDNQVRRITYLGGLGDTSRHLSPHLRNRAEVAHELQKGRVPVTSLRAAIIIGSGSASYEIIHHLVKNIPVILIPSWAQNKCEPIAVRDVIKYLVGVLEIDETSGRSFDIGGRLPLTYERLIKLVARLLNKRTVFIPFFISNTRLYSYVVSLLTPVPATITQCLMESLRSEVVCQEDSIKKFLPFQPVPCKEAIVRAMTREEQDDVATRWSDAYPPAHELAIKLHEAQDTLAYHTSYCMDSKKEAEALFRSICHVGGKHGWFNNNWLWRLRGMIDRLLLGVGTQRGRKKSADLMINDVVDFWRVEDIQKDQRLLLRAEMKLPGRAWLEFLIKDLGTHRWLAITAFFDTQSLWGKVYWYICMPFHHLIFKNLIEDIERRS